MSLVRRAPRSARFVSFGSSVRPVVSASSLNHQRWASTAAPKSGTPADKSATSSTKELTLSEQLDLILPFEWDLEYLKKFEIAPPTSEQMAKSIPAPEVEGVIGRAGQLASDLFEIAYIYEKLQDIGDELGEILQFSKDNAGFADRIVDKGYTKTEQRELFEKLFQKSSPLLKKFVARMVENNDLHRILQVAENYQELLRAYRKEVHVVLALAKIPPPARLESIKSRAAFYYLPRGVTPVWDIQERPELIEGYTLSTKELSVDVSAAGRQKKIKERLEKIFQKAEAATIKPPALGMPMYPIVIRQGDEIQQLAASLKERADEQIQLDEVHYNIHFVEWA